ALDQPNKAHLLLRTKDAASAKVLAASLQNEPARWLTLPGSDFVLSKEAPKCLKDLDTYFLHQVGFKHLGLEDPKVEFVHSLKDAKAELQKNPDAVAILMRATPLRHIAAVADASESMPPKSTFFHPKIPSGILIHPLEPPD
ncbi:MAG: hypothetical protein ABI565_13290, partial [Vicinamibacteria bacterium]